MATRPPELVFTLAGGQNHFFVELAEALVDELHALGARARIATDEYPEPARDAVRVLLPPHEYVTVSGFRPPPELLGRCIGISAEQPASIFFEGNVELARELGAVFDINPRAIRAYRRHGVAAEHLQLGHCRRWDRFDAAAERDIDVVFIGRLTTRRERALATYADTFERLRVHIQLGHTHRPGLPGASDFSTEEAKRELLGRAKVLLNIHADEEPYFEWLRVAEAISAGCVVVSEHSSDIAPLRFGEHLLTGGIDRLGLLCAWLAESSGERERLATAAHTLLRDELPLARAATTLAEAASRVDRVPLPKLPHHRAHHDFVMASRPEPAAPLQPPPSAHTLTEGRALRATKWEMQTLLTLRRRLERLALELRGGPTGTEVVFETAGWAGSPARQVAVIVPLYNHAGVVLDALDSVTASTERDWELVVVDDGSSDHGPRDVEGWLREHDGVAGRLVRHHVNRGLPAARNTGVAHTEAEMLVMLDADNQLRPTALERLLAALRADPAAAFAYGIVDRFNADGPVGLISVFPWDPERLRESNYIDALAMIRRERLLDVGGYSEDPRLALGWEDYDLWARFAEAGEHAAFVPEMIARYRLSHSSMVSVTNVSVTDAFAAVADHAPRLMRGLRLPH
jgi:hypothetical protein